MTLGFILFLLFLAAVAVVIWDYEQKWELPWEEEDGDEGF